MLDGRHRLKACLLAGREPRFVEFSGGDPYLRVWDRNGARREWSGGSAQKYAVWKLLKTGSDEWTALQAKVRDKANATRAEKIKDQPRSADGKMAVKPTVSGRNGKKKGSTNAGAKATAGCVITSATSGGSDFPGAVPPWNCCRFVARGLRKPFLH